METGLATTTERLQRTREVMAEESVDLLLVAPSADLRYLTGHAMHPTERPTLLALGVHDSTILLVPALEAPLTRHLRGVRVLPYEETQDPYRMLAGELPARAAERRIAISDQMWSAFLLRLEVIFAGGTFLSASTLLRRLRMIKSSEELDLLTRAAEAADAAFARIVQAPFAGRTERQIGLELSRLVSEEGLERADWGPIVASGPHAASPHHLTGDREIQEGDVVVLDYGGVLEGYQADITRTVHVGTPTDEFRHVYDVVRRAEQAGVEAGRPGVPAEDVDKAARDVIQAAGYGEFFVHRTGHGIGLDVHEEPYIVAGNRLPLEPGMTFSVEPGIYLPEKFGVRVEDIVRVTDRGLQRLNKATRDVVVVS